LKGGEMQGMHSSRPNYHVKGAFMRSFKHLTADQRYQISDLRKEGLSYAKIANQIGVNKSTISREFKINSGQRGYRPRQAQEMSDARKAHASLVGRNTRKFTQQDKQLVESMLRLDLSPKQISGRLRLEGRLKVSHETLYRWVYANKKQGGNLHVHLRCQKLYRKRYASGFQRRGSMPGRVGIEDRPAIVKEKSRIGDWEGDTIIGKNHKGAIATLADRHSRFFMPRKSPHAYPRQRQGVLKPRRDFRGLGHLGLFRPALPFLGARAQ
jgi:IS30 family transposase